MTDYSELVKALRLCQFGECGCGKCYYKELKGDWCTEDNHPEFFDCDDKLKLDAAAAIEALQAEVDKANKSADAYRAMYFTKHGDITIEKVRELDEIDCHFHSALIRLMYKRIEELDAEETRLLLLTSDLQDKLMDLQAQLPKLGEWQKAKPHGVVTYSDGYAECSHCHEAIWLGWGMNFCPNCGTQNKIIDPDDYDGAKMEVQDG